MREEKIKNQLDLQFKIQQKGFNIVTCGRCGDVLLHEVNDEDIECPHCDFVSDPCDFPDLFYEGIELSSVFK